MDDIIAKTFKARVNENKNQSLINKELIQLRDADLLSWTLQILEAINFLHTKVKVVHRDIKPAYIVI